MDGADAEQVMMMEERVILVDAEDNVLGHESKKNTHLNSQIDGKNLLHRAFSVFLFNDAGELLMQQRSDDKITFPLFWANSCCSHPLYRPEELEKEGHLGVKRAAVRKIEQELGIDPSLLPLDCFTFVTRVYYKARSDDVWGEHEIDHILVCRPPSDVLPHINTNECKDARYFSASELDAFVEQSDANGDLVSPWFRVIHREKLPALWDATMSGNLASVIEEGVIHREEGVATNYCTGGDTTTTSAITVDPVLKTATTTTTTTTTNPLAKQGAYGKVGVHKHGKLQQLRHLDEVWHMLVYKLGPALGTNHMIASGNADDLFCDEILGKVSRSFAGVIRGLPACLQLDVCVFYLALRGLDTVEDDMDVGHISVADKLAELHAFHEHLSDPGWSIHGVGDGDERRLVENFGHVARAFLSLAPASQEVIADITARMGGGMAEFIAKVLTYLLTSAFSVFYLLTTHSLLVPVLPILYLLLHRNREGPGAGHGGPRGVRPLLPLRRRPRRRGPLPALRVLGPRGAGHRRGARALGQHGALPAEDEHHPRLPGGLRRRPRLLAQGDLGPVRPNGRAR